MDITQGTHLSINIHALVYKCWPNNTLHLFELDGVDPKVQLLAAAADGSWLEHERWTAATFELAALSEPPEEELMWAITQRMEEVCPARDEIPAISWRKLDMP